MRRVLAAFMVLMMAAAAGSAHAAGFGLLSTPVPQATEQISAFTFRNGISWNMSTEQVRSLEVTPMNERTSGEWSVMMTAEKVAVSRFTADLVFIFRQNQLRMITYEFNHNNDSVISFYYLIGALEFKYGKAGMGRQDSLQRGRGRSIEGLLSPFGRNRIRSGSFLPQCSPVRPGRNLPLPAHGYPR